MNFARTGARETQSLYRQGIHHQCKAMFQMMGVSAEFERAIIQERVRAGLARAKSEGKRLGSRAHQEGSGNSWKARRAHHCRTVRCRFGHRAADQPPFRKRRRRGR